MFLSSPVRTESIAWRAFGVELERFPEIDLCEVLLTLGLELFML